MPKPKIDKLELNRLLRQGKTKVEAARHFNVSPAAISKACKGLGVAVAKNVTLESAARIVEEQIDVLDQLRKINRDANELLDLVMRWNRGEEVALQILESQVKLVKVGQGKDAEWIKEYKLKDPREIALKAMSVIQSQLEFQLNILERLFDVEQIQKFQSEIIELLGEVSPEMRNEFLRRLHEKSALRRAVNLNGG